MQGEDLTAPTTRANLPIPSTYVREEPRKITQEERDFQAYRTLRDERAIARNEGKRKLREAKVRIRIPCAGCSFVDIHPIGRRPRRRPTRRSKLPVYYFFLPCTTPASCSALSPCTQNLARPGFYSIICHMHQYDDHAFTEATSDPLAIARTICVMSRILPDP